MDNNELYVNEEIEKYLDTKDEMKELDTVTVKSLFRTCIESVNPELPRSSVIIKGIKNSGTSYSVKLKNIKLNLSFALDMILGIGGVIEGSKLMLIFLVFRCCSHILLKCGSTSGKKGCVFNLIDS